MHSPYWKSVFQVDFVSIQKFLHPAGKAGEAQSEQSISGLKFLPRYTLIITPQLGVMVSANQTLRAYTSLTSASFAGWLYASCDQASIPLFPQWCETTVHVRAPYSRKAFGSSDANVTEASSARLRKALCWHSNASSAKTPPLSPPPHQKYNHRLQGNVAAQTRLLSVEK